MRKIVYTVLAAVLALGMIAMTSCGKSEFTFSENTEKMMTVKAVNASKDSMAEVGTLEVGENEQISISSNLDEGTVLIEILGAPESESAEDAPELDSDPVLTGNMTGTDVISGTMAPGGYMVRATVIEKATGTVDIEVLPADPEQWNTAETAEEAGEKAGLGTFSADPSGTSLGEVTNSDFRWMENIAEGHYGAAAVDIIIHKGASFIDEGDVSFDYNKYSHEWTVDIDGTEIKCFGIREGEATKSIWTKGDYGYAIMAYGAGGDTDYGFKEDDLIAVFRTVE